MPSHHFHHHHALVRVRGGFQTVQRLGNNGNRTVEAKSDIGCAQVIINGFWHANYGEPYLGKQKSRGLGAVSAHNDQGIQPQPADSSLRFFQHRGFNRPLLVHAYFDGEVAFVHGSQNGAPLGSQSAAGGRGQPFKPFVPFLGQKPFKTVVKTHNVPAATGSRAHNTFNNCIQPGGVTPAIQNTDVHIRRSL